ncbi:ankyrin repeat domain-containing protein [Brevibacillus brevis]|uniref:Ankyrin repeat domain-containing protein n=1 Tax=Brevibacillus brevis TaxID=1393 RepID=A0A2Z4MB09_BREBE|nr:ankyrin repeat domain-containing protein [Brevibacillus brevis]AWX53659.1 ankyrin repeat domain-containing protein [Brevibacillus brevis]
MKKNRIGIYILLIFLLFSGCTNTSSNDLNKNNVDAKSEVYALSLELNSDSFLQQIEENNNATVALFLKAGIDPNLPNKEGEIPIVKAALNGNVAIVNLLINANASINLPNSNGTTALMAAAANNQLIIVQLLLQKEANIEAKDNDDYNALMLAIRNGDIEITKTLIDAGANPNITEGNNRDDIILFTKKIYPEIGIILDDVNNSLNMKVPQSRE